MVRLPIINQDEGAWGALLNEYLLVSHNADGTLKPIANPSFTGTVDASTAGVRVQTMIPLAPTPVTPSGGTAIFNLTLNNRFTVTLTGATTFAITGDSGGQPIMIRIVGNGNAVTWWPGITWSGGAAPTLTGGGKADWIYLQRTGANTYDGVFAFGNL